MNAAEIGRPTLGEFMSLVCFQYLRVGTEEVADRAPVVAAGRTRGFGVIQSLGLAGKSPDAAETKRLLNDALGVNGTRLCIVNDVIKKDNGGYEFHIVEGACTAAGQKSDTPHCAFTLGVFIGAAQALMGVPVRGTESQCIACGADECVYHIEPL